MSDIFSCPAAFEPFFTERVRIDAPRPGGEVSGGYKAMVSPILDDEPILEDMGESSRQRFAVLIPIRGEGGWNAAALGTRPQIGDKVTLQNGTIAHICKVSPLVGDWYEIEARV